jgi:hypothetical protein
MESTRDIATQTVSRILGDAAFIFTDALTREARPSPEEWEAEGISLKFIGQPSGEVRMWVGSDFACIAAANMLGIDTGSEEAKQKGIDALKELLNMVVGNFMTAAYGEQLVFTLGLPQKLPRERLASDFNDSDAVWLEAEGSPVMFLVKIASE